MTEWCIYIHNRAGAHIGQPSCIRVQRITDDETTEAIAGVVCHCDSNHLRDLDQMYDSWMTSRVACSGRRVIRCVHR